MDIQVLTPEEFAQRIKISRTTESEWRRKGYLNEGLHFFKHDRTIRYIWGPSLFDALLQSETNADTPHDDN